MVFCICSSSLLLTGSATIHSAFLRKRSKSNQTSRSFDLNAPVIGDKSSVSMAEALTSKRALRTFTLGASENDIGDEIGCAMANVLQLNKHLQYLNLNISRTTLSTDMDVEGDEIRSWSKWLDRNAELLAQKHCLATLARATDDLSFDSLVPSCALCAVFAFLFAVFLPRCGKVVFH